MKKQKQRAQETASEHVLMSVTTARTSMHKHAQKHCWKMQLHQYVQQSNQGATEDEEENQQTWS